MDLSLRICLWIIAAMELVIGTWTLLFPESFYNDVPTVDLTPPYSERLFRDFGGATLGIAIVLVAAASKRRCSSPCSRCPSPSRRG